MAVTAVGQPVSAIKVSATSGSFSSFTPVATSGYVITVSAGTDGGGVAATITGIAWATGVNDENDPDVAETLIADTGCPTAVTATRPS